MEVDLSGPLPRVNGREIKARLDTIPGTPVRLLRMDQLSQALIATRGTSEGEWRITLNGRPIMATALDERTRAIRCLAGPSGETGKGKTVLAPMPGLVTRVLVEPGASVSAGEGVVVVEAMKMENELKSPAQGTVAQVLVQAGQTVEKGALLVVLE